MRRGQSLARALPRGTRMAVASARRGPVRPPPTPLAEPRPRPEDAPDPRETPRGDLAWGAAPAFAGTGGRGAPLLTSARSVAIAAPARRATRRAASLRRSVRGSARHSGTLPRSIRDAAHEAHQGEPSRCKGKGPCYQSHETRSKATN